MLRHKSIEQDFEISLVLNDSEDAIEYIVFPIGFIELESRSRTKILNQIQTALYDSMTMEGLKVRGMEIEVN